MMIELSLYYNINGGKKMYKTINKESLYYGSQVILMVTKNPETKQTNITPISSSWTLNKSIVLGLGLNQQVTLSQFIRVKHV